MGFYSKKFGRSREGEKHKISPYTTRIHFFNVAAKKKKTPYIWSFPDSNPLKADPGFYGRVF